MKRKILIVFFILFIVFLSQVMVSGNSVIQMQNDFILSAAQNRVKDDIYQIIQSQEIEDKYLKQYALGLESSNNPLIAKKSFDIWNDYIDSLYINVSARINGLFERDGYEVLNIYQGIDILYNIEHGSRKIFLNQINSDIFSLPSLYTLDKIEQVLIDAKYETTEIIRVLTDFLLNRQSTSKLILDSHIAQISDILLQLYDAYNPIERINQSIFDDFETFRDDLSLVVSDITINSNELYNTIEGTVNFVNTTQEELNDIQNKFDAVSSNITLIQNLIDYKIFDIFNFKKSLTSAVAASTVNVDRLNKDLRKLISWANIGQNAVNNRFRNTVRIQIIILLIIASIGTTVLFLVNISINRDIINPIGVIALWSEYIAEGDLTKTRRIRNRSDEVGVLEKSFKHMNSNLRGIIKDVHEINELISYTSEELSSNTQEINATAEEVSAIAQSMATGSTQQAEIITTIVEELQEANDVVDTVINQITHNLSIVKDLSEQTNVLALNTAIEAANAGEFGKGFTVIAENIRKMSDQSSRTAKIITRDSKAVLNQLQISFSIITEKIENVAAVSQESAASAEEVAASAEELTATIQNISAKSAILNDQSIQSMKSVSRFILTKEDYEARKDTIVLKRHKDIVIDESMENEITIDPKEDMTDK